MKSFWSFLLILTICTNGYSQSYSAADFGKVNKESFLIQSSLVNESTNAVIIGDVGNVTFKGNNSGWFSYVYKRYCRIKVCNSKGFDAATFSVVLYKEGKVVEEFDNLKASTYNLENGEAKETKLEKRDVYTEQYDKDHTIKKFTMPNIKEGSIIEVSYTVISDFLFNLPSWEFQDEKYPTLWSEYTVAIPSLLSYMTITQGLHSFFIDQKKDGFQTYSIRHKRVISDHTGPIEELLTVSSPTINKRWAKKNIPPFKRESFIASPKNDLDKVYLQLYETYDGAEKHPVAKGWGNVTKELMKRSDFGEQIQQNNSWMDKVLQNDIGIGDNFDLQMAQKIYKYVQANTTCTNFDNKYITSNLKDVLKKRSGSVGDINLLLIALLHHQNFKAYPVLLSTREFGRNFPNYPFLEMLNYVICVLELDGKKYFLDAAVANLAFGKLPLNCYNGHARIISNDTTAVYFSTDSVKESEFTKVIITPNTDGSFIGQYNHKFGYYNSLDIVNKKSSFSVSTFLQVFIQRTNSTIQSTSSQSDTLQTVDDRKVLSFDFAINSNTSTDMIYLNPYLDNEFFDNPFKASERSYPVEMPYTLTNEYELEMGVPAKYKVEEIPAAMKMTLNESDGYFEYTTSVVGNKVIVTCKLELRTTNFAPDDYINLREFYANIAKKVSEQIVFKKM